MDRNGFKVSRIQIRRIESTLLYRLGHHYRIMIKLQYRRLTSTCMEASSVMNKGIVTKGFLESPEAVPVIRIIP